VAELSLGFGPMVVMNLHFGRTLASQRRQRFNQLRRVGLRREEEGVTRTLAPGIASGFSDDGPLFAPQAHSVERGLGRRALPKRLEVIRDGEPHTHGSIGIPAP